MSMDDRTVIRPTPGGRRPRGTAATSPPAQAPLRAPTPVAPPIQTPPNVPTQTAFSAGEIAGCNPILTLITPLLTLVGKVKLADQHPNLDEFHRYAVDQIKYYQSSSWGFEDDAETSSYISYALCSLVDETVQNTPWGLNSDWGRKSLLITFHQEAWGGEKFFQFLQHFMQRPSASLMLLELYYTCLSLGFEGEHRGKNNGRHNLDILKDDVYVAISRQRNTVDIALSPAWVGISEEAQGINRHLPLWIIAVGTAAILLITYLLLMWQINTFSDISMTKLAIAGRAEVITVDPSNLEQMYLVEEVSAVPQLDLIKQSVDYVELLSEPLNQEVSDGIVEIIDEETITRVRLRHAKLFASGSANVSKGFEPLIAKIGELLTDLDKTILVVGHSDNIPMRSGRYTSNWALSTARAESVQRLLISELQPKVKVIAEGVADSDPLVANNSAENRALNRRVEIHLRK